MQYFTILWADKRISESKAFNALLQQATVIKLHRLTWAMGAFCPVTPTKGTDSRPQYWFSPKTEQVKAVLPGWNTCSCNSFPCAPTPSSTRCLQSQNPPRPATATPASASAAPEKPLLFLHPGDGFESLALPAASRCAGRNLLLGRGGPGADGRRAFEEGLHDSDRPGPGPASARPPPSPHRLPPRPRRQPSPARTQPRHASPPHRRPFPPTRHRPSAEPLPPTEDQSQSSAPPRRRAL